MIIREYLFEDAHQVEECIVELQDYLKSIEPKIAEGKKMAEQYLKYLLTKCAETKGKIFVAEADNRIIGMICVYSQVKSDSLDEEEYEYAYISDAVVLAAHRKKGLGLALLKHAEEYAKFQGAKLIRLSVLAKNIAARKLYAGYGFQENLMILEKRINLDDEDAI